MRTPISLAAASLAALLALPVATVPAQAAGAAEALRARHEQLKPELANNPFGRPLVLQANAATPQAPSGDIYAVIEQPFAAVRSALGQAGNWCDVMILQSNIKRCAPQGNTLAVAVGRKFDQPVEDAFVVDFRWALRSATNDHLGISLSADEGPLSTRNYKLSFQAVPIDAHKTFVHMSYAYEAGLAARMATDAYLATAGRSKVGFSRGNGGFVGGVQGVAERNTMRYFLAIESYLRSLQAPEGQRVEQRLRDFFAATERYPQQLREMTQAQYLGMKRKEVQQMHHVAQARREAPSAEQGQGG
jgi:hypothetical protein